MGFEDGIQGLTNEAVLAGEYLCKGDWPGLTSNSDDTHLFLTWSTHFLSVVQRRTEHGPTSLACSSVVLTLLL